MNFTPWGIRLAPIVVTLSCWTLAVAEVAWVQRSRIAPEERFEIPWNTVAAWVCKPRRPTNLAAGFALTLAMLAVIGAVAWKV